MAKRLLLIGALVVLAALVGGGLAWLARDDGPTVVTVPASTTTVVNDRSERAVLLGLLRKSAAATWWVEGAYVRSIKARGSLRGDSFQVHRPPDHLVGGGGVITGVINGETVSCSAVAAGYACAKRQPVDASTTGPTVGPDVTGTGDPGAYLAAVTSDRARWYMVRRLPDEEVAGVTGACFRVEHRPGRPAPLGTRVEYCYSSTGVPLRWLEVRGDTTTSLTTTRIHRSVTDTDLERLATSTPPEATASTTSTSTTTAPPASKGTS